MTKRTLRAAMAEWRAQPEKARRDAIHFFRDEARQSLQWAKEEPGERARHKADARAMRAAVALLTAAQVSGATVRERRIGR